MGYFVPSRLRISAREMVSCLRRRAISFQKDRLVSTATVSITERIRFCKSRTLIIFIERRRGHLPARLRRPVLLSAAGRLVGDGHFQPAGLNQGLQDLIPELGAVLPPRL